MTDAVDVALPLPLQSPFSYRVPAGAEPPERGVRVLVPFGARRVIGIVTGPSAPSERELKPIVDVIDEAPLVPPPLLDLAAWVADHYLAPPGECYRLALPPAGLRASRAVARLVDAAAAPDGDPVVAALQAGPARLSALARRLGRDPAARLLRLRRAGAVRLEQDLASPGFRTLAMVRPGPTPAPAGPAQAAVLERLKQAGGPVPLPTLIEGHASWRSAVRRLEASGGVVIEHERWLREPVGLEPKPRADRVLSAEQDRAAEALVAAVGRGGFETFLLHGITGSGKTEVYFRAVERALAAGRGCLVLVPEIALTPLLVREARSRFGAAVSVLHSELSAGERHDQWWRIRDGDAPVVIGARSAVFAPLPDLGLVVVDEEHDAAYKQEDSPRYHARDVAVLRARLEGAVAVLGSATPSVESYTNALRGKYVPLVLSGRFGFGSLPRVEVVDLREVRRAGDDPVLSAPLREALAGRLSRGEQALVLLNRRGWATSLICRECATPAACPNCSVSLTLHSGGRRAVCHYCGHQGPAPQACADCRGEYLRVTGYGTERVAAAVREYFPDARVERVDRDVAVRRGALAQVLAAFEARQLDVLVGTQMIAKGHDFPGVSLVGVVNADVGLGLPDFRAAERTFQLLTQVAGRAGRGEVAGEVVLQTHLPDHYALGHACAQEYEPFYEREIEFRRTMGYPPVVALVNLVFRDRDARRALDEARGVAESLRGFEARRYRVLGPAWAPLARLRSEHRVQVLLKGDRASMRAAVAAALGDRYGAVRWPGVAVDVDPVSVL